MLNTIKNRLSEDPRIPVAMFLASYLILGLTVLGFNRSPWQIALTILCTVMMEVVLFRVFKGEWKVPLSAFITGMGLSILLNYSHTYIWILVPAFFAIGSKYIFTLKGRHFINPAQAGVVLSLVLTHELITAAPAYQWHGYMSALLFVLAPGILYIMPKAGRLPLIISFLITFTVLTALRAFIMRHHLPFSTLFLGTITAPSFFLFTFFMITDPATSPAGRRDQIITGILLAVLDLAYHLAWSYHTFFYAAFTLATSKLLYNHYKASRGESIVSYATNRFWTSGYYKRPLALGLVGFGSFFLYQNYANSGNILTLNWSLLKQENTGIKSEWGYTYERLDPRIQHMAKWIMSATDGVAVGDINGDGLQDLFLCNMLKKDDERNSLYINKGNFTFEKVEIPALKEISRNIESFGLPTNAMFVDYNNDSKLDLFITYAFGSPRLLKNTGESKQNFAFTDVTAELGLDNYGNSVAATFLDINRDGKLDLFLAKVIPDNLPGYHPPEKLNFFKFPQPQFEGDERMFDFMHDTWHMANNGGMNEIYLQNSEGKFEKQDSVAWGMPETRWSLAVSTGDFNQDGWEDVYVANDFGPDDLYFNVSGRSFLNHKGNIFGSVGKDTYKGMNATVADFDRNGWQDIYISNVHHAMQAEGSLLWMFGKSNDNFIPKIEDKATKLNALNEDRFGWGAAAQDFNNDGWVDIAQANGMVNNKRDKTIEECKDYWYVNEKIARSPPEIHRYVNRWGDIRGMCIYGYERNRLYLNQGNGKSPQFVDVAQVVGMNEQDVWRGISAVDLNNDGRMDILEISPFDNLVVRANVEKTPSENSFVGFSLEGDGVSCNKEAIGSTVTVSAEEGAKLVRQASVVDGLSAQNDRRMHFGLGKAKETVNVTVNWCGLWSESFSDVPTNRYNNLKMSQGLKIQGERL